MQKSGMGASQCRSALKKCRCNYTVALKYLELKNCAVNKKKVVNGRLVRWSDSDYVAESVRQVMDH